MKKIFMLLSVFAIALSSCKEKQDIKPSTTDSTSSQQTVVTLADKQNLHKLMQEAYFWYQYVPQTIDYGKYSTLASELDALKYKTIDNWSFMMDTISYRKAFQEGESASYGMSFGWYNDELYVSRVDNNSPAQAAGVKRGFKVQTINNIAARSLTEANADAIFQSKAGITAVFQLCNNGECKDYSLTTAIYTAGEVYKDTVITTASKKVVGYMGYAGFIGKSISDFNRVFAKFKAQNVTEVVLDLRNNGGGSIDIADTLVGYLAPVSARGSVCTKLKHNIKYQKYDKQYLIPNITNGLNLSRLFVLVNKSSASASELTISSLMPYMDVQIIGSYTHGKPVGMEGFGISQYVIFPISFAYYNANDYGDYFSGIPPKFSLVDNFQSDLGSPQELYLKTALYYIENGSYPTLTLAMKSGVENDQQQHFLDVIAPKPMAFTMSKQ